VAAEHETPGRVVWSPAVRRYVYGVFLSAGPVVLFYGLLSAQEFAIWAGLAASVLGLPNGLALANTPPPK
jgi:hypothetical protein